MNNRGDNSFQGILYRPNVQQNLKLDKKFMRKKRQIFQSNKLRKLHKTRLNDQSDTSLISLLQPDNKQIQKIQLPNIYLYSKPKHKEIIPIEQTHKLVKQISKNINFVNKKISVLNYDLLNLLKEQTKSISYESDMYTKQLQLLNIIFGQCGIILKPRDVMLLQGQNSKTKFSIFTNHPKHPQSLCCQMEVIIKHIEFLSAKNYRFSKQKSFQAPLRSIVSLCCLQCGQQIIKIRPSQTHNKLQHVLNDFEQQKRLINYSKLISSGRYKQTLINDESVQLMKSRNLTSLNRSKTSLSKIKQIQNSENIKNSRYLKFERQSRVKSYGQSLNMKQRTQQNKIEEYINKRKNNISQIIIRKDTV